MQVPFSVYRYPLSHTTCVLGRQLEIEEGIIKLYCSHFSLKGMHYYQVNIIRSGVYKHVRKDQRLIKNAFCFRVANRAF